MSHSIISPSSADVWSQCAGAPLMIAAAGVEDDEGPDALEGTASHWVVAAALDLWKGGARIDTSAFIGNESPDGGAIITSEMVECANVMIEDVIDNVGMSPLGSLHVEEHMEIPSIHEMNHGTPDAWHFNDGTITLWDYKYGHRDIPADSWQNINYIAGILDVLRVDGIDDQNTNVVMKIVQPRSFSPEGPVKVRRCKASDLRAQFNILVSQAARVFEPDPGVKSGDHCRYCPVRHACPAARNAAYNAVDYIGTALPDNMTPDAVSFELNLLTRATKALTHRHEAIKQLALSMMSEGKVVPGYMSESGQGDRKFNVDLDELAVLGEMIGIDMVAKPKPITPAEFDRRLIAKNKELATEGKDVIDKAVINNYIHRPDTGLKLKTSDASNVIQAFKNN